MRGLLNKRLLCERPQILVANSRALDASSRALLAERVLALRTQVAAVVLSVALILACAAPALAWAEEDAASDTSSSDTSTNASSNQVYVNQLSDSSFLYETSIADIAQADSYYDGQTVQVQGEVVGDLIDDELSTEYCWITLQDDEASPSVVSVYLTREQASVIDTYGEYGKTGTILQVRGVVHLECSDHQGMADIHADEVSAVAVGTTEEDPVDRNILIAGILAAAAGAALFAVYHIRRERSL